MAKARGPIIAIVAAGAAVLVMSGRRRSSPTLKAGKANPVWPIVHGREPKVPTSGGKAIGASRPNDRQHAGIDLIDKEGLPVVATETGRIVAVNPWDGPNAKSLLLETDSGIVVNYGAVAPNSWYEFGVGVGSKVVAGQPIARIGRYPGGSAMLHFELYSSGTRKNARWQAGKNPPSNLLDPTDYLQRASNRVIS